MTNTLNPGSQTPWKDWMHANLGQPMVTGKKASAFEIMVFSHTSDDDVAKTGIEESGCAATACAALELNGMKSPHSAAAASFASYGTACELKPGCIVVFKWSDGGHHVTFCDSVNSDGGFQGIGGNQGSPASLCIETFGPSLKGDVIGIRWPGKA